MATASTFFLEKKRQEEVLARVVLGDDLLEILALLGFQDLVVAWKRKGCPYCFESAMAMSSSLVKPSFTTASLELAFGLGGGLGRLVALLRVDDPLDSESRLASII